MGADQGQVAGWLQGRLPDGWFTGPAEVTVDREEIMVVGMLAAPEGVEGDADGPEATEAARGRISRFRETTREERIEIAHSAICDAEGSIEIDNAVGSGAAGQIDDLECDHAAGIDPGHRKRRGAARGVIRFVRGDGHRLRCG